MQKTGIATQPSNLMTIPLHIYKRHEAVCGINFNAERVRLPVQIYQWELKVCLRKNLS